MASQWAPSPSPLDRTIDLGVIDWDAIITRCIITLVLYKIHFKIVYIIMVSNTIQFAFEIAQISLILTPPLLPQIDLSGWHGHPVCPVPGVNNN